MYLHHLILPKLVSHDSVGKERDVVACEPSVYMSRSNDEVACVVGVGHDAVVVVEVIVVAIVGHYVQCGHALCESYPHVPVLCLIALHVLDERTLAELPFYLSGVYLLERLLQGV